MQHIVVMSSRTEPLRDAYWIVNGVGRRGIIHTAIQLLPSATQVTQRVSRHTITDISALYRQQELSIDFINF